MMYVHEKINLIHLLINELIEKTHHCGTEVGFEYSAWIESELKWAEGPIRVLKEFYEEEEKKRNNK